jgi:hypothetical protein
MRASPRSRAGRTTSRRGRPCVEEHAEVRRSRPRSRSSARMRQSGCTARPPAPNISCSESTGGVARVVRVMAVGRYATARHVAFRTCSISSSAIENRLVVVTWSRAALRRSASRSETRVSAPGWKYIAALPPSSCARGRSLSGIMARRCPRQPGRLQAFGHEALDRPLFDENLRALVPRGAACRVLRCGSLQAGHSSGGPALACWIASPMPRSPRG